MVLATESQLSQVEPGQQEQVGAEAEHEWGQGRSGEPGEATFDRRSAASTAEVWRTVGVASSASPTGRSSAADADLGRHPCSFESLLVPTSPASRLGRVEKL